MLAAGFFINRGNTPSNSRPCLIMLNNSSIMLSFFADFNFNFVSIGAWLRVLIIYKGCVERVEIKPAHMPALMESNPCYFPFIYNA